MENTIQQKESIYIYKFEYFKGRYTDAVMYDVNFVKENRENVSNTYPVIINRYKDHKMLCPLNTDMIREIEGKIIMTDVMNDRIKFVMYSFDDDKLDYINGKIKEMNLSIGINPDDSDDSSIEGFNENNYIEEDGIEVDKDFEMDI